MCIILYKKFVCFAVFEPKSPCLLPRVSPSRRVSTLSTYNISAAAAAASASAADKTEKFARKEPTTVFPILASPTYRMLSSRIFKSFQKYCLLSLYLIVVNSVTL